MYFFAFNYYFAFKELQEVKATESKTTLNTKVVDFTSLFIKKVLQANTEVGF